jgi:hypothetical protein
MLPVPPTQTSADAPANADLFDYRLLGDYAFLLLAAPKRHKLLFTGVFAAVVTLTVAALLTLPKKYTAEVRILAQRSSPNRYLPGDDSPMRAVAEVVLNTDNLESLVSETKLLERWKGARAPAARARDAVMGYFDKRPPSEEDRKAALVATLEKSVRVSTGGEGVVSIAVSWQDPRIAYDLVQAAQRNFFAAKASGELAGISETLVILEGHATSVRTEIEREVQLLAAMRARDQSAAPRGLVKPARKTKLEALLPAVEAKRRVLRSREVEISGRIEQRQRELTHLRSLFTDNHPLVIEVQQALAALRQEPADVRGLRDEVQELENEALRAGGELPTTALSRGPQPMNMPREVTAPNPTGDPNIDYEAAKLRLLIVKYNNLLDRIDAARIDLETTRAALKQRYAVIRPPRLPDKADNLEPPMVIAAGIVFGLVLAMFVTAAAELAAGRIRRRWQLERLLGVPVFAQLDHL